MYSVPGGQNDKLNSVLQLEKQDVSLSGHWGLRNNINAVPNQKDQKRKLHELEYYREYSSWPPPRRGGVTLPK